MRGEKEEEGDALELAGEGETESGKTWCSWWEIKSRWKTALSRLTRRGKGRRMEAGWAGPVAAGSVRPLRGVMVSSSSSSSAGREGQSGRSSSLRETPGPREKVRRDDRVDSAAKKTVLATYTLWTSMTSNRREPTPGEREGPGQGAVG